MHGIIKRSSTDNGHDQAIKYAQTSKSSDQGQILDKQNLDPGCKLLDALILGDPPCITTHVFYWELMCVHIRALKHVPSMVLYLNCLWCRFNPEYSGSSFGSCWESSAAHWQVSFYFENSGPAEANFHWTGKSLIFIFITNDPAPNILVFILIACDPAYLHFYSRVRVDERLCLWKFYSDSLVEQPWPQFSSWKCTKMPFHNCGLKLLVRQLLDLFRRPWQLAIMGSSLR